MTVNRDMVVNVHPNLLAFGIDIGTGRKGLQGRTVKSFVKTSPGAVHLLERAVVEILQLFGDGVVQLADAEEGVIPKRRQDPPFRYENGRLHLGLVLGLDDPGGDNDRIVVASHFVIGRVDVRFIIAGFGYAGFQVVGNENLRYAPKEIERPDIGVDPGGEILGNTCPGKGIVAGAEGGNKEIGVYGFSCQRISNRNRLAGVIKKEFFSRPVGLAKADIQLVAPLVVMVTELAVLIAIRVDLPVFQPQQPEGHPFAGQLLTEIFHVGKIPLLGTLCRNGG
ncbi:MAG: hypothetical protein A4E69_01825 [Syntrophus sp. PtaB.Bin138]|nr:MAG: hypothetical protein A4E69_01825 [Syntrophus sp. PtaB.Bin138]